MTKETEVREDDACREYRADVNVPLHWIYLPGLLGASVVLMLLFIAFLGA